MNDRQTKSSMRRRCVTSDIGAPRHRPASAIVSGVCPNRAPSACVIRLINARCPRFESSNLPPIMKEVVLSKRGLVILVGGPGLRVNPPPLAETGWLPKRTRTRGHIVTIEDPVEYATSNKGVAYHTPRVGVDPDSGIYRADEEHRCVRRPMSSASAKFVTARNSGIRRFSLAKKREHLVPGKRARNKRQPGSRPYLNFFPGRAPREIRWTCR